MARFPFFNTVATIVACATLAGCATTQEEQDQTTGAVVGCAGGAIIGALLGNTRGAIAGCAAGALVGWGTVKMSQYNAAQARSSSSDQNRYSKVDPDFYGYARSATESSVKIRGAVASPETVRRGSKIVATTDYSLITPKNVSTVTVQETWTLKKDGKQIIELKPQPQTRTSGGWDAQAEFPIPQDADPGTYVIEHKVKAGSRYDKRVSVFVVS